MEQFKTTQAAAKRLCNYLNGEYKTPILLLDGSNFDWREFVVVPFDKTIRKAFISSYEANIHNTTSENLIQSFRDTHYTVALILNTSPLSKLWIDMGLEVFLTRTGLTLDLEPYT